MGDKDGSAVGTFSKVWMFCKKNITPFVILFFTYSVM